MFLGQGADTFSIPHPCAFGFLLKLQTGHFPNGPKLLADNKLATSIPPACELLRMPSVSTLVGTSVGPNCSVSSPQIIYISWHFASGAAPGKSTSSCTLTCTVNSGDPAVGWPEGSVEARTPLSPVWSSYRDFGLMEHDSWAPGFLGAHLWHFLFHYSHIVRVISREPPTIWCIITQKCCRGARSQCLAITFFLHPLPGTVCLLLQNL